MVRGCFWKTPSTTSNLIWLLILTGSDRCPEKFNDTAMMMFWTQPWSACWKQTRSKFDILHFTHCPKSEQNPQHTHPHPQPHDYPMLLQSWCQGSCVLGCCAWLRDSADSDRRSDCGRLMLTLVQNGAEMCRCGFFFFRAVIRVIHTDFSTFTQQPPYFSFFWFLLSSFIPLSCLPQRNVTGHSFGLWY